MKIPPRFWRSVSVSGLVSHPFIHRDGDRFLVYLPDANVWGEGVTLEAAYAEFQRRLSMDALQDEDHMPFLPPVLAQAHWKRWRNRVFLVVMVIALAYAQMAVWNALPSLLSSRIPELLDMVALRIDNLSPPKKEQLRARIRKAVTALSDDETQTLNKDCHLLR